MRDTAKLLKYVETAVTARSQWDSSWQDLADALFPSFNRFTVKDSPGVEKRTGITNGHVIDSLDRLSAAYYALIVNPATVFFDLTASKDKGLPFELSHAETRDLQILRDGVLDHIRGTHFYETFFLTFRYFLTFANACVYVGYDESEEKVYYKVCNIGELAIRTDRFGKVDTVFRTFCMPIRQAIEQFGREKLSRDAVEKADNGEQETIDIIHAVIPVSDTILWEGVGGNFRYNSVYLEKKSGHLIDEGGYYQNPYVYLRDMVAPEETYGRGLGSKVLPEARSLYNAQRNLDNMLSKACDPPMGVNTPALNGKLRLTPGSITHLTAGEIGRIIAPLYVPDPNAIKACMDYIEIKKTQISQFCMVDLIQFIKDTQMTATEVLTRDEYQMRLISPFKDTIQRTGLGPVLHRTLDLLDRYNHVNPIMPALQERGIEVNFTSALERGQRLGQVIAYQKLIELALPLAQVDPVITQMLNTDNILKKTADILGVDVDSLKSKAVMKKIRDDLKKQEQKLIDSQMEEQQAIQAKTQSEAQLNQSRAVGGAP